MKRIILACDGSCITPVVIEQLIDFLPPPDQMKKLEEFKDNFNELADAEQFILSVSYN